MVVARGEEGREEERTESSPFGLVGGIVPRHDDLILLDVDPLLLELSSKSLEKLDSLGFIDD